jgi:hypothetical protein
MASVTINGRSYSGNSITIRNNHVTIDGVVQDEALKGVVEVRIVEGILGHLETDASVTCGDVREGVMAGGSVSCKAVTGTVQAGGSVSCGPVSGSIMAGGSVRHG